MAQLGQRAQQQAVGKGTGQVTPVHARAKSSLLLIYRALAHKIGSVSSFIPRVSAFYTCRINVLRSVREGDLGHYVLGTSTHSCPYIYTHRDSTHVSTVTPPTLLISLSTTHSRYHHLSHAFCLKGAAATVLSPTFLPFFQSLLYRSSNHGATVTLPTKKRVSTVLSPTKSVGNLLNLHQTFSRKDVFKRCLKKTSGLMRLFFILVFFSSEWRASNS